MTDPILSTFESMVRRVVREEIAAATGLKTNDEPVSLETASEYLNVSVSTIRRRLKAKELRGKKIGREWRVMRSELKRFVQE